MNQRIAHIALVVRDYGEAITFYTEKLAFMVLQDKELGDGKRWVVLRPPGAAECSILLAKATSDHQVSCIGNQTGGRVFLFLHTDDFWRDYNAMVAKGVEFLSLPKPEPYGMVAVFKDLYGTKWDLLEPIGSNV